MTHKNYSRCLLPLIALILTVLLGVFVNKGVNTLKASAQFTESAREVRGHSYKGLVGRVAGVVGGIPKINPQAKPEEARALIAKSAREVPSLEAFFPERFDQPFVVEGGGVRAALWAVGGHRSPAEVTDGKIVYREAYPHTDSRHEIESGRSEEFLYLKDESAPRQFEYDLAEVSGADDVLLRGGAISFRRAGREMLCIESPWVIDATGRRSDDAVRWDLGAVASDGSRRLVLTLDPSGLQYPLTIDPSWSVVGSMSLARNGIGAVLLQTGMVLVVGCSNDQACAATAELYDPTTGAWRATGAPASSRAVNGIVLLKNGKVLAAGGSDGSAEIYDPTTETWSSTGSLNQKRIAFTMTPLADGRIMAIAGYNWPYTGVGTDQEYLDSVEIYDPSTGVWTATGSLARGRLYNTATLLPNGKVLVAGGYNGNIGFVDEAELYDPASGTWSDAGSIGARWAQTATLLPNGKVLLAGGRAIQEEPGFTSAKLYDPSTGVWSDTGSLNTGRAFHSATLLPNGKVLVSGGETFDSYDYTLVSMKSVEIYDPATETWSTEASLTDARAYHTSMLLPSGDVLVTGGLSFAARGELVGSTELYDPTSGSWSGTGALSTSRQSQTATILKSGKVLVAGGGGSSGPVTSAELYDMTAGTWSSTGSLTTARGNHTATLLINGNVLVVGGEGTSGPTAGAELYNLTAGSWSATGSISTARKGHTATLLANGKVLIVGGNNGAAAISAAELYDPVAGTWSSTGSLAAAREDHTATLLPNGKVLVVGGRGASYLASAELYDPAAGTWSNTGSLSSARASHSATLLPNGNLLVAGGADNSSSTLSSAELYSPSTGTWSGAGALTGARQGHTATLLPRGRVLVVGGSASGTSLATAELYNPIANTWSSAGSLSTDRTLHTSTLLTNGRILVAAGRNGSLSIPGAELYDPGLGYASSSQPVISTAGFSAGGAITVTGTGFGGTDSSGGTYFSRRTDYPLVQLISLVNGQSLYLPLDTTIGWSKTAFTSSVLTLMTASSAGFPVGHAQLTVIASGVPSTSTIIGLSANTNPTITASTGLSRTGGITSSNSTIATVGDLETLAGSLTVTVTSANPAGGVTISNIVNTNGTITADIVAACAATAGTATFTLQVSDGSGGTATTTLSVAVVANTAPTLTYSGTAVAVNAGASTTINPATGPSDNSSVSTVAVQSQGTYTGTITVNSSGVVSISNAAPAGTHTITIRATDNCGMMTDATISLTVNALPTITAASGVSRIGGTASSNSTIATVTDAETALSSLTVTVTSANPTGGVTISNIVNTNGTITADIVAACSATAGTANFTLQVSNGVATATATLSVTVNANTAPVLTYNAAGVLPGASTIINPATGPSDNGSVSTIVVQSQGTFTGTVTVNSLGVVSISNAAPVGTHTITIRATDNCGTTTDATILLALNQSPTIIAASGVSRIAGNLTSNSTIATVTDAETAAGSLTVTVTSANPTGGVTISNIVNTNGTITADIVAACAATSGTASFTLQVSDGVLTTTATLNVAVNANIAPTVAYGSVQNVVLIRSRTIAPTSPPADDGGVTSVVVQSRGTFTGTATVDAAGVVTIASARPVGTHTITIRVTDGCGLATDASFSLVVNASSVTVTGQSGGTSPGGTTTTGVSLTNNGSTSQTVSTNIVLSPTPSTTISNCVTSPGTCTTGVTSTQIVGFGAEALTSEAAVAGSPYANWTALLAPGQTGTMSVKIQVGDQVPAGTQICFTVAYSLNGEIAGEETVCFTVDAPASGPGNLPLAVSPPADQKPGSVLIYNLFTSSVVSPKQNTQINITNVSPAQNANVHLFFVDGATCSVADRYLALTPSQTTTFLASDFDPGTTGYIVAVATDDKGCPVNFNFLIGDAYVTFDSGHAANLAAIGVSALAGGLPACDANSVTATLNFDGVSYNQLPRAVAVDNINSRAAGNQTMLILNRLGGNLLSGADKLGTIFGLLYDDQTTSSSFTIPAGSCQLVGTLSNSFPRTAPRFDSVISAGRTGWMRLWQQSDLGISGAVINFQPNGNSREGGHNLHTLTTTATVTMTIPVFPVR